MEYCNGMMYAVKNGDTLYSISMKYNIPLALLLRANPYVDVYHLQVGETICLPVKQEQGCDYNGDGRCVWERGEDTEETRMENTEKCCEREENAPEGMEMEQTMNREEEEPEDDRIQWERFVTQPGDTLDIIMEGSGTVHHDDWEDVLEDFVEKNGMNRIYLLPGIAYYRQK